MKILILGASGMLGRACFRLFSEDLRFQTVGTVRSTATGQGSEGHAGTLVSGVDALNPDDLIQTFASVRPDTVINCVGLVKQMAQAEDPIEALPVNSLLPHRLARLAAATGARLIHMSTDCVFSGTKGNYRESDIPDAYDLYGRSKLLGEVDYPNAITIRTSIIGHEALGQRSLINWFLAQNGLVKGYSNAIFSGLPTVEMARLIRDHVLPNPQLRGVYHVSAEPIDKYRLLKLVARVYRKDIVVEACPEPAVDRSLDSTRFRAATGFVPKSWPELIASMEQFR